MAQKQLMCSLRFSFDFLYGRGIVLLLLFTAYVSTEDGSELNDSGVISFDAVSVDASPILDSGAFGDVGISDSGAVVCESEEQVACGTVCTDLTIDSRNCGSCGVTCIIPRNSLSPCTEGQCAIGQCDFGYFDRTSDRKWLRVHG